MPTPVADALDVWLRHHDDALPGLIDGLYVVGSVALDDWRPGSDADVVVLLSHRPTADDVDGLRRAHENLQPDLDAIDVDGPMLVAADLAGPPAALVRPWTLHREFHHDDGCFELNPAQWHCLARHGVTVRGRPAGELDIHLDARALHEFVVSNTDSYWRSIADAIAGAVADPERTTFSPDMTSWCVLGPARMLFTAQTGDVTSKTAAGEWVRDVVPGHADLADHALAIRRGEVDEPDTRDTAVATEDFVRRVVDLVVATDPPG